VLPPAPLLDWNEGDAPVGGVARRDIDCPAACLVELVAKALSFGVEPGAPVVHHPRQIGMIGEHLVRLFERVFDRKEKQAGTSRLGGGNRGKSTARHRRTGHRRRNARLGLTSEIYAAVRTIRFFGSVISHPSCGWLECTEATACSTSGTEVELTHSNRLS
jgi:hypothetical protein